ncbi:hypothetical protein HYV84_06720 [Candidatus Woesearchaeota archaeon]|nr:hypothetical protein [Candidatus Woesearchaeota archaeon]
MQLFHSVFDRCSDFLFSFLHSAAKATYVAHLFTRIPSQVKKYRSTSGRIIYKSGLNSIPMTGILEEGTDLGSLQKIILSLNPEEVEVFVLTTRTMSKADYVNLSKADPLAAEPFMGIFRDCIAPKRIHPGDLRFKWSLSYSFADVFGKPFLFFNLQTFRDRIGFLSTRKWVHRDYQVTLSERSGASQKLLLSPNTALEEHIREFKRECYSKGILPHVSNEHTFSDTLQQVNGLSMPAKEPDQKRRIVFLGGASHILDDYLDLNIFGQFPYAFDDSHDPLVEPTRRVQGSIEDLFRGVKGGMSPEEIFNLIKAGGQAIHIRPDTAENPDCGSLLLEFVSEPDKRLQSFFKAIPSAGHPALVLMQESVGAVKPLLDLFVYASTGALLRYRNESLQQEKALRFFREYYLRCLPLEAKKFLFSLDLVQLVPLTSVGLAPFFHIYGTSSPVARCHDAFYGPLLQIHDRHEEAKLLSLNIGKEHLGADGLLSADSMVPLVDFFDRFIDCFPDSNKDAHRKQRQAIVKGWEKVLSEPGLEPLRERYRQSLNAH